MGLVTHTVPCPGSEYRDQQPAESSGGPGLGPADGCRRDPGSGDSQNDPQGTGGYTAQDTQGDDWLCAPDRLAARACLQADWTAADGAGYDGTGGPSAGLMMYTVYICIMYTWLGGRWDERTAQ